MNITFKVIIGVIVGLALGIALPFGISALNILPFLRTDTPYETVLKYMFFLAIIGAIAGGSWSYRMARKSVASK